MRMRKREKGYQQELLEWQWHQLRLQKKYRNTPAGFLDKEAEKQAFGQWKTEVAHFRQSMEYKILSDYQPAHEDFVGRTEELAQIRKLVQKRSGPVILYGIGGIGKSALARAYIRRYGESYDHILFLSYNTNIQRMVCDDYMIHISNLQYSKEKYGNKARYFQAKQEILSQIAVKYKLLIVIDDCNAEFDKDMEALFSIPCDHLVTTRIAPSVWGYQENGFLVKELRTEEEWDDFLECYRTRHLLPEDYRSLYSYREKVQGHTLKMMLKIHNPDDAAHASGDFNQDLFGRFRLKKEEREALMYLSIMPAQGIPHRIFQKISNISDASIYRLYGFLLLQKSWDEQWKDDMIFMHPLIADAARQVFHPSVTNCGKLLTGFKNYLWDAWEHTYIENQRLEPYVFAFLKAFPKPAPWLATAFGKLYIWLWIQGYYEEAKQEALKVYESVEGYYGEAHQITGMMAEWTAGVYYNALDFEQAGLWYQRSLDILRSCKFRNSMYTYQLSQTLSKLARDCRHRGELKKALELLDESIALLEEFHKYYEEPSMDTDVGYEITYAYRILDRGKILFKLGDLKGAEEAGRNAYRMIQKEVGDGFRLNEFQCFLIDLLLDRGEYEQAEPLAEQVVRISIQYRGEATKHTLICRETLADIYLKLGKTEAAMEEYNRIAGWLQRDFPYQEEWFQRICEKIVRGE